MNLDVARKYFKSGDASHWTVARPAYQCKSRKDVLQLADAIDRTDDTVRNLADAYSLFRELLIYTKFSEPIRRLRRKFPYTRWAVVYRQWYAHEFHISIALDWLENFEGGNDALAAEIENKYGAPEWERRANTVYRQAYKLQSDFGVPDGLQKAAVNYVKEFDAIFPKVKK